MSAAQIAASLKADVTDCGLSASDQLLFALADALVDTGTVDDVLWEQLAANWSQEQLVEFVAVVGYYHQISFSANALRVPLEAFGARFAQHGGSELPTRTAIRTQAKKKPMAESSDDLDPDELVQEARKARVG